MQEKYMLLFTFRTKKERKIFTFRPLSMLV